MDYELGIEGVYILSFSLSLSGWVGPDEDRDQDGPFFYNHGTALIGGQSNETSQSEVDHEMQRLIFTDVE